LECATSTRSGACPIRRRGRPAGAPTHEATSELAARAGGIAAAYGLAQARGSRRMAGVRPARLGQYQAQAAAPSLVLERPWLPTHTEYTKTFVCSIYLLPVPVVLSALGGQLVRECAEVSLCTTIGHHQSLFSEFQVMAVTKFVFRP